jgi:hypothetical protein
LEPRHIASASLHNHNGSVVVVVVVGALELVSGFSTGEVVEEEALVVAAFALAGSVLGAVDFALPFSAPAEERRLIV